MRKNFSVLTSSPLFEGISAESFEAMLDCLGWETRAFEKGETILFEGDAVSEMGVLASGKLHLVKSDVWGNNSIMEEITPPGMFAEAVCCGGAGRIPVSVVAREASEVLFLDYKKIVTTCPSACAFHAKLVRNMIGILARKNILLSSKMEHITKRTTKEKLLSYLGDVARQKGGKSFDIPFNRQELADYLSVERSALSVEMGKLKAGGVIDFRKNHFELL
ncbi:MAG: Crp/Fnr family transcriptional regulator [Clostridiales Family XIII bacterium]|jgi:CRP-like cAMP-binding protein|nr:Crp/Fnr family transcriptional regulator [Clostridiales Family XIII bacterium]